MAKHDCKRLSRLLDLLPELPLLLRNLELKSLNAVLESLPSLLDSLGSQLGFTAQLLHSTGALAPAVGRIPAAGPLREAALLKIGPCLEGFDAALDAVNVRIGAIEQGGNSRTYLVAQRGFGGCEGGLGNELVVLGSRYLVSNAALERRERDGGLQFGRLLGLTRTVLSTLISLGKSATPFPSVSTEDSRCDKDPRRAATQSP